MKTFAEKLKAERERLDLTQAQAAQKLDILLRTYVRWEHEDGKKAPPAITQEGALARLKAIATPQK